MNRQSRLAVTVCLGLIASLISGVTAMGADQETRHQKYLALRHYVVESAEQQALILRFFQRAGVPALNRAGVEPVGVFTPAGKESGDEAAADNSVYVLTEHDSLEHWASVPKKLAADEAFHEAAAEYLDAPKVSPAYSRIHVTLMKAFEEFPAIQKPESGKRIFELRTYESHSELKAAIKVAMFNEGELAIFKKVGMKPVFFGETIAGPNLPNLTYMLVYTDMDEHKQVWQRFVDDPDWHTLRDVPRYADTVSNIHSVFLVPAEASQL